MTGQVAKNFVYFPISSRHATQGTGRSTQLCTVQKHLDCFRRVLTRRRVEVDARWPEMLKASRRDRALSGLRGGGRLT